MSLSAALGIAQSSLFTTSRQTSTVSRNITEAQNPDYSRRTAALATMAPGVQAYSIQRSTNEALFRHNLAAISSQQGQRFVQAGLDHLQTAVNGVDNASSPATAISNLQKALQFYAATPSNLSLAENTIEMARQTVAALNNGTDAIQAFRTQTDAEIATAVADLRQLLSDFEANNQAIVKGTQAGRDVNDELDQRDRLLKKISEYVPISTQVRGANDMVITTRDGAMLFETSARAISFEPTNGYDPTTVGGQVRVDGVIIAGGSGGNTTAGGKLAAMTQMRDEVSMTMQAQLDEVARGLISAFRETGGGPDAPGLFTWPGAPGMPPAGVATVGLAGSISINPAMDSSVGGNPHLLRDGGANGAGYVVNATGGSSFSDLLIAYGDRLNEPLAFDAAAGAGTGVSVATYASNTIGWLESLRKDAASGSESKAALLSRTTEALSNATGVNIDEEMAMLLQLEHSYQASARLIKAVDDMLAALMGAVR
ncbi:MAG: flagellar hook-associated protein FlgK [Rhizobiaceae bacterium]|nr:flagellar hook-associated protein FlgK [Rhizobiaceae bacterium]MCV0407004.1 flagellar hook-associated protein FlgK [Rhizobiaceae bacterium]